MKQRHFPVARRGGSGNPPHVRVISLVPLKLEVFHQGEWREPVVQLPITPDDECHGEHSPCPDGPDFCEGFRCFPCQWVCPNSPEEPITYGVPF